MFQYRLLPLVLCALLFLAACTKGSGDPAPPSEAVAEKDGSGDGSEPVLTDVGGELLAQLEEIEEAVSDVDAKKCMGTRDEQRELVAEVEGRIAALGYSVSRSHQAMLHHNQVEDFFRAVDVGEAATTTVYSVWARDALGVNGWTYVFDGGQMFKQSADLYWVDGKWQQVVSEPYLIREIRLTEQGNLMEMGQTGDGDASGFRVTPLAEKNYEAYWNYVALVDVQADGVLSQSWSGEAGFRNLPWEFVFETIWQEENEAYLLSDQSPYYDPEEDVALVPAGVVEDTLRRYFDVSTETLRQMTCGAGDQSETVYQPAEGMYRIAGFRGGGYKSLVEVWDVRENGDGSLDLDIAWVSLDFFGDEGFVYSTLTVLPREDGSFRYLSNVYSDRTVQNVVGYTLELARSADLLYQGGFETEGEPVEIGGHRFAPVDQNSERWGEMRLGGTANTRRVRENFELIFSPEAAAGYLDAIFSVPLYADGTDENGDEVLLVNAEAKNSPIVPGTWSTEDLTVLENTPDQLVVRAKLETEEETLERRLVLRPGLRRNWVLTGSYSGDLA